MRSTFMLAVVSSAFILGGCSGGDSTDAAEMGSENSLGGNSSSATQDGGGTGAFDEVSPAADGAVVSAGGCASSPANMEIAGNGCDDDGDGQIDEAPSSCDSESSVGDGESFAKALGVCQKATGDAWGLVAAEFVNGAKPKGSGKFGNAIKAREGSAFGMIETNGSFSGQIPICPVGTAACTKFANGQNVSNAHLTLKVPANAKGLAIDYDFYTAEWPLFVGGKFNDGFVINVSGKKGSGNIAFDANGGVVDVNNGFFDRCTPGVKLGCAVLKKPAAVPISKCAGGTAELQGTPFATTDSGYDMQSLAFQYDTQSCWGKTPIKSSAGATGWLSSQTPVEPGETLEVNILIWNAGDAYYQSLALVDNLRWIPGETTATTTTRAPVIN